MRGSLLVLAARHDAVGSIPTCAGQPQFLDTYKSVQKVYPHVCGEPLSDRIIIELGGVYPHVCGAASPYGAPNRNGQGLSPRVRGSPHWLCADFRPYRSIPTCAGQPNVTSGGGGAGGVYPHVCGAAYTEIRERMMLVGLSPRVRGSRLRHWSGLRMRWSIPTCAGQPHSWRLLLAYPTVYPHVCGAARGRPYAIKLVKGLSPRVRGSLEGSVQRDGA